MRNTRAAREVKSFVADGHKGDMEMAPCHSVSLEQAGDTNRIIVCFVSVLSTRRSDQS